LTFSALTQLRQFKLIGAVIFFSPPQALCYKVHLLAFLTIAFFHLEFELQLLEVEISFVRFELRTGVVEVAQDAKDYVKSVFGTKSPQYKQVSAIKFTKRKS